MYETRFVVRLPLPEVEKIANYTTQVIHDCGEAPTNVSMAVDEEERTAIATVTYMTTSVPPSDCVIAAWRGLDRNVQVERNHKLNPDQFDSLALAGANGRKLRFALARNVRELCVRGVGSKGILEYLIECEDIVRELREFVESQRAPV